jgi:hypothetical protein
MIVESPPNTQPRIDEMWVYVSIDSDGNEGVVGSYVPGSGWVPLMATDPQRLELIRPMALAVARQSGMRIRLVKFSSREVLETIDGGH